VEELSAPVAPRSCDKIVRESPKGQPGLQGFLVGYVLV